VADSQSGELRSYFTAAASCSDLEDPLSPQYKRRVLTWVATHWELDSILSVTQESAREDSLVA
jgi:hypothetical protein